MRYLITLLLVTATIAYAGIAATNSTPATAQQREESPNFIKIEVNANPTNDFSAAIASNDVRFVGYMGYALIVPGIKDYYSGYDKSNGVKIIAGTSDVISPTSFPPEVAHRYAAAYNELLLRYLKANQKK
jgi:hypothetical protein